MEAASAHSQSREEDLTMEPFKTNQGICSTCNHLGDCEHYRCSDQPIWFCEDFDNTIQVKSDPSDKAVTSPPPIIENGYMGLCVNCDHRESCINAQKPGGVWHCEEYS